MTDKNMILGVMFLLLVAGGVFFVASGGMGTGKTSGSLDARAAKVTQFAQCLKDSGTTFYGAFWCPHCKSQKALFGDAAETLPYVECSTSDGNSQTQVCKDKEIRNYPTWEFKDGSRITGEQTFAALASKSGCADPDTGVVPPPQVTTGVQINQ